jgi:thiol-disulfide isomerase/thioredoxin
MRVSYRLGEMKTLLSFVFLAALTPAQQTARPAPALDIHMADGSTTKLSGYKGKVVLLALLNTGCTHCQHFAGELAQFQKEYGPKGVQVAAVVFDNDAKKELVNFRDRYVKGFPVGYSDEATVMKWLQQRPEDGYFVPIVVFINRQGMIESQHLGDDNLFQDPEGNIRHKLDQMLKRPGAK